MAIDKRNKIVPLTDSSGGTVSTTDTVVDVPASYTEATLANQLATLTAKLNEVIEVVQKKVK